MPAREAAYAFACGPAILAIIDEISTIDPPPDARIAGATVRTQRNIPKLVTSITRFQSSTDPDSIVSLRSGAPATITAMSSRPYSELAKSTAATQSASFVTSA